ncbi:phasin family protein [Pseudomonas sp. 5P_3.1_Bac2]|uniref:phasin family protein n=1 Tax=Pseudomonas sp. 5P_3.1_Bac2 TaxID=2971617 RepID=UPI0021C912F7|nr:phasin family protein [Pseudomonas sp. 5P_3.1_Bac2]MCU1717099.1 phasin family protein [Pseudomonas sp. 5P_3.1_Bac2]
MGFFKAVTKFLSNSVERAGQVLEATVDTVKDVAKAVVTTTTELAKDQVETVVDSVKDALSSVDKKVHSAIDSVEKIVDDTASSLLHTIDDTFHNSQEIVDDLLHGRIEPQDYLKLIGDLGQGAYSTVSNAYQFSSDSLQFANSLYNFANKGGSLSLGDSNGVLGINLIGSLLGGNTDQGVIPDTRGSIGALPINVSFSGEGISFGGEATLTPLIIAALSLVPITAPLVPLITPLNLGGIGVVGSVTAEGFSAKFYGIAGPSYNAGVASAKTTVELGSYTNVQLVSWNTHSVTELPLLGSVLGKLPFIKDLSFTLPSLDLHFDSKLYAQANGSLNVAGTGPQAQLELVHDLDNNLNLLAKIADSAFDAGLHGADNVFNVLFHGAETDPSIQTIGSGPGSDQALAA